MKLCTVCKERTARKYKERFGNKTLCEGCYGKGWRLKDVGKNRRRIVAVKVF